MTALLVPTALTLALLAGIALLARRARVALRARAGARALEVLDRAQLGPKQGVAAIRVADRVLVVSQGEGGVRALAELSAEEWRAAGPDAGTDADAGTCAIQGTRESDPPAVTQLRRLPRAVTGADRRMVAPRLRRFLTLLGMMSASLWPGSAVASTHAGNGLPLDDPAVAGSLAPPQQTTTPPAGPAGGSGLLQALPPIATQGADADAPLELSGPIGTALLFGVMALLPTLLLLATGFTRILIVLHLLKQALGAQAVPPTHLVNALALLLTLFLMGDTLDRASREAIGPWLDDEITQAEMFQRVTVPFRDFMVEYASEDDVARFVDLRGEEIPASMEEVRFTTLMAAFTTSELKRAFQLGFVLFLPFIVIDLVVASVLMSMGMFMLPPVMISLPFKLLLFVLADGWGLVVGGLLSSFG